MQQNPLWPVKDRFPKLEADTTVDVAVVGAGMAGISSGYFLQAAGYEVLVLEKDEVGSAASGASSGILFYGTGTNLVDAVRLFGREEATLVWKESEKSIHEIAEFVEGEQILCALRRPGAIMIAQTREEELLLADEHNALKSIGVESRLLNTMEIKAFFTPNRYPAGLEYPICTQLQPAVFAAGLAKKSGLPVYEYSPMMSYTELSDGVRIQTPEAIVACRTMIVATNLEPFYGLERHFTLESSALVASKALEKEVIQSIWPEEKFIWTADDEYDILYPQDSRAILEVYKLKTANEKLQRYLPGLEFTIDKRWGDSWSKAIDWLPIIGKVRSHVYAALAMGDQGVVMGFTAGRKMTSLIQGKDDPFLRLTSLERFN